MKRIVKFKKTDCGYACFENEECIFEISKDDLQFDVKAFYHAFYDEEKDFESIELENCDPDDKDSRRIYECIVQLMGKIQEKLAELASGTEDENAII